MEWRQWVERARVARVTRRTKQAACDPKSTGRSSPRVCRWERGTHRPHSADSVRAWALALHLDVEEAVAAWRCR